MSTKKKTAKRSKWTNFIPKRLTFSERNQKLIDEINSQDNGYSILEVFTKWRLITYVAVVFLPPYGLYRVWSKESTFRKSEKVTWTFMIVVYMFYFVTHLV